MTRYKTYQEFINEAYASYNNPKEKPVGNPQRIGQHLMDCLYAEHPRLYNCIISLNGYDPYYNNQRIPKFLLYVEKYWEGDN